MLSLVALFAIYLIIDGIFATVSAVRRGKPSATLGYLTFEPSLASRLDAGAQPLDVALAIGAKVFHFGLGLGGNRMQA